VLSEDHGAERRDHPGLPARAARRTAAKRPHRAWVRFISVSLFLALVLVCGVILGLPAWQGHLHIMVPYWLLSLGLLVLGSRSEWLRQHGGIAIALLDMPVVFLLLRGFVAAFPITRPGRPRSASHSSCISRKGYAGGSKSCTATVTPGSALSVIDSPRWNRRVNV
jgi:hypothetical protein